MKRADAGLTIVELLVAMTIFSVIVAIAITILLNVQKTQRQLDKKSEISGEVNRVADDMEYILKSARKLLVGAETRVKLVDNNGDTIEYCSKQDTLLKNQKPATALSIDSLRFCYAGGKEKETDFRLLDQNHDGVLADSEVNCIAGIAVSLKFSTSCRSGKSGRIKIRKDFFVALRNLQTY